MLLGGEKGSVVICVYGLVRVFLFVWKTRPLNFCILVGKYQRKNECVQYNNCCFSTIMVLL